MTKENRLAVKQLQELTPEELAIKKAKIRQRQVRARKFGRGFAVVFRSFFLIGLCFLIIMPIFQKFSYALRSPYDITNPQVVWIPETWSTENFYIALHYLGYRHSFWNSLSLALVAMLFQIFSTALAGYAFAKLRFKGSNILFYLAIFTLIIPNDSIRMARYLFYLNTPFLGVRLIGSVTAIAIMSFFGQGLRSGIFIFLFRQAFRGLPVELEESAEIDGAGVFQTFYKVMLPNVKATTITVALFAFIWQWNDYYFANLFGYNIPLLTLRLASGQENLYGVLITNYSHLIAKFGKEISQNQMFYGLIINTAALLMMLPVLIAYMFIQRKFVQGIERTGITGM